MKVRIGNSEIEIKSGTSLIETLEGVGISDQNGVAIAINNIVIPKSGWVAHQLEDGDQITVIKATAGG